MRRRADWPRAYSSATAAVRVSACILLARMDVQYYRGWAHAQADDAARAAYGGVLLGELRTVKGRGGRADNQRGQSAWRGIC
mmetsp:Transcript_44163/g.103607  ORF Transcript_44163/g.103607 Transcript_44163/m.103607 type:complete len:82 (+) Transcript_44163:62-307(+)